MQILSWMSDSPSGIFPTLRSSRGKLLGLKFQKPAESRAKQEPQGIREQLSKRSTLTRDALHRSDRSSTVGNNCVVYASFLLAILSYLINYNAYVKSVRRPDHPPQIVSPPEGWVLGAAGNWETGGTNPSGFNYIKCRWPQIQCGLEMFTLKFKMSLMFSFILLENVLGCVFKNLPFIISVSANVHILYTYELAQCLMHGRLSINTW